MSKSSNAVRDIATADGKVSHAPTMGQVIIHPLHDGNVSGQGVKPPTTDTSTAGLATGLPAPAPATRTAKIILAELERLAKEARKKSQSLAWLRYRMAGPRTGTVWCW